MGSSTEQRDKVLAEEHAYTRKLKDLDAEAERRKQRLAAAAASKVAGVEKDYKAGLEGLSKERRVEETREGEEHKKRMAQAKAAHQSALQTIANRFEDGRDALRGLKQTAIEPIEEELAGQLAQVDEWRVDAGAVAEQEHLENLAKAQSEEKPQT